MTFSNIIVDALQFMINDKSNQIYNHYRLKEISWITLFWFIFLDYVQFLKILREKIEKKKWKKKGFKVNKLFL